MTGNSGAAAFPQISIPAQFEQISARYPDKVAVKRGDEGLTYAEINALANRLARTIIARRGAAAEAVALVFDRRPVVVAAMFGVLKTGKFYVPIDISDPPARLETILADAQAQLIVTDDECVALARSLAGEGCTIVNIDALDPGIANANLGLPVSPEAMVYLLYTSGTTGTPKGIGHRHATILRFASDEGVDPRVAVLPFDRLLMLNSLSVMGSAARIFGALLVGASVAVYDLKTDGLAGLAAWLGQAEVTVFQSTSTIFRHFCATLAGPVDLPKLRTVKLMGETILKHDVALFKRYFPAPCVMQLTIGTTETRAFAEYVIDHTTAIASGIVPAGYPKYDAEIEIWDETGAKVGSEQVGEIVVKSPHIPSGYWRRPEISAGVFVPDPAGGSLRYYRTGDLGRLRHDGMLEHLGRKDQQVKIRGNRIESGEVESALLELDGVREAVALARDDPHGEKQLVAYLVSKNELPASRQLRQVLGATLPAHALPAAFIRLDAMPLNAGGKLDRNALPAPDWNRLGYETAYVAPRTPIEAALEQIWARLLERSPIGIHDDFFARGGHSLLAARMLDRIQAELRVRLELYQLVEHPTIAALAGCVERLRQDAAATRTRAVSSLVAIRTQGTQTPFFLVPGGTGSAQGYVRLSHALGDDQPLYAFEARGSDGKQPPHVNVAQMAADYIAEMRNVQPHGPYALGGECIGGMVAYEMAQQLAISGEAVGALVLLDTRHSGTTVNAPTKRNIIQTQFRYTATGRRLTYSAKRASHHLRNLQGRRPVEQAHYLFDKVRKAPGVVSGSDEPLLSQHRRIVASYPRVIAAYQPNSYAGALTLLVNAEWHRIDPALGWDRLLADGLTILPVPGTHTTYLIEHVRATARQLNACLNQMNQRV